MSSIYENIPQRTTNTARVIYRLYKDIISNPVTEDDIRLIRDSYRYVFNHSKYEPYKTPGKFFALFHALVDHDDLDIHFAQLAYEIGWLQTLDKEETNDKVITTLNR